MNHFSPKTMDFLVENRLNDSRDWYQEHKGAFTEYVLEPFQHLVAALSPTLLEIDGGLITEPKVDRTISRVYRDTRFSRDKSIYRDHMWCVFMRDKKLYHGPPAFYFEISPELFRYGCGYYQASGEEMEAMRQLILENHTAFAAARKFFDRQDLYVMEGDSYKRPRYPDAPAELQTWLNRKSISFNHNSTDTALLYSEGLAETVAAHLRLLKPVY